ACVVIPLQVEEGNRTIGSVLIAATPEQINSENFQNYIGRIVQMASGHLEVVIRANRGLRDIVKTKFFDFIQAKLAKTCLIGLACVSLLMCVPLPYRVACDCEVQPVLRRFVASPHDGILEKTFVESGDIVEANQVVAILDGRQKRIELSALRAELAGAKKKRDSSLAQGDVALSHIARSEMRRHQSKIDILEQQMLNLEVRSPIAGIVVSGDLDKVQGAPLEMGQTLFEIAPLDKMLAEIGIPESEIHYVEPGMTVTIKLDSFPFKTWQGTVQKIQPRSEIVKDESVFIAQVILPNEEQQIRPGMQGSVKVSAKSAPIGWNLFHTSWESVRYWLIW
ncbi:MAG: efflux RND transporter periplasmic adaptor subunit, partial [Mariniblastus sp.]